ncbi:MAG: tRNA (uridine(54)-C5)-methyltransferase TrmA [Proteobacteria bacterium]|nr:MAG: tRNA (uridine(54)-C5)-methyltransferase TrmA [Pseudomonadota bacterium]
MDCKYFNLCGSCTLPFSYEKQLDIKIKNALEILGLDLKPSIIKSPQIHYRNRAEFRIWHEGEKINYALNSVHPKSVLQIDSCTKVDGKIYALMPKLLDEISKNQTLKHKLFAVEFLSSSKDMLITLIYHKKLDEGWLGEAKRLSEILHINIIGRSRKIKLKTSQDFIGESLNIDEKNYHFNIYEGAFSQPNRKVNEGMISWVKSNLSKIVRKDLLELYCGHGNFTIPLGEHFNRVLATEISKTSIKSALKNCQLNHVKNVNFLRMSVEELVSAFKKEREFFRLRKLDLDGYEFSHVFVDPPRAGLDSKSLDFIKKFENIIYISCSLQSLKRDLKELKRTHKVLHLGFFDQFAYTNHLESGVILVKK